MQTIGKALSLKTRLRFWGNRGKLFFPGDVRRERVFHNQSKHSLQRLNTLHRFGNSKTYTGNTEIPNPPVGNKPTGSVAAGGIRPPGSRGASHLRAWGGPGTQLGEVLGPPHGGRPSVMTAGLWPGHHRGAQDLLRGWGDVLPTHP